MGSGVPCLFSFLFIILLSFKFIKIQSTHILSLQLHRFAQRVHSCTTSPTSRHETLPSAQKHWFFSTYPATKTLKSMPCWLSMDLFLASLCVLLVCLPVSIAQSLSSLILSFLEASYPPAPRQWGRRWSHALSSVLLNVVLVVLGEYNYIAKGRGLSFGKGERRLHLQTTWTLNKHI